MDAESRKKENDETSSTAHNHPSHLTAMDGLVWPPIDSIANMALAFSHRCLSYSLLHLSYGLLTNKGFKSSLSMATSTAKFYGVSSSVFCACEALLAKLRGTHDFINAGVAGCCVGLLRDPAPGAVVRHLQLFRFVNCLIGGGFGIADFNFFREFDDRYQGKDALPIHCLKNCRSSLMSGIEIFAERFIITASIGTFLRSGNKGLKASFEAADPLTKLFAVVGGVLGYSSLLLWEMYGEDNDMTMSMKMGLYGATASLFSPETYGSQDFFISRFVGKAALAASFYGICCDYFFFPRLRPTNKKFCAEDVLAPFTLPLPMNLEDGFSVFYDSVKKKISSFERR